VEIAANAIAVPNRTSFFIGVLLRGLTLAKEINSVGK